MGNEIKVIQEKIVLGALNIAYNAIKDKTGEALKLVERVANDFYKTVNLNIASTNRSIPEQGLEFALRKFEEANTLSAQIAVGRYIDLVKKYQ